MKCFSASQGWGLIVDAIAAEIGILSRDTAEIRALETLEAIRDNWPRDPMGHGWFHWFTHRSDFAGWDKINWATIDSAALIVGALTARLRNRWLA